MAINLSIAQYVASVSEMIGHKTGLCLNENDLSRLIHDYSEKESQFFLSPKESYIRIRSEDYEATIAWLLYKTGYTDRVYSKFEHVSIFHKYKNDETALQIYLDTLDAWNKHLKYSIEEFDKGIIQSIDPTPVVHYSTEKYGDLGALIAGELVIAFFIESKVNAWSNLHTTEWKDRKELEELFKSESLETQYGSFFDQRFIHYLLNNFDDIDKIHWRKFEGLTCEFFDKLGYHVEIGPGRDDGGVDLRVWRDKEDNNGPACILVQCKRQKAKIEKVVVKALWADMIDEDAQSGMIVTSSALSPGSKKVCLARGYKIDEANRDILKKWLLTMRRPGHGIFMGE